MNSYNLAVVFTPNIFQNPKLGMQEALNAPNFVKLFDFLIINYQEIFNDHE